MTDFELTAAQLEMIQKVLLTPFFNRLDKIEQTLDDIKSLYKSQSEMGTYIREMKSDQKACEKECKRRLDGLEGKPEKSRQGWKDIFYFVGTGLSILAVMKAFGVIK